MTTLDNFTWGTIRQTWTIGRYTISEYIEKAGTNYAGGATLYHGWIDGKDVHQSWDSLDGALVGLIVRANLGLNQTAAADMIMRGLKQ